MPNFTKQVLRDMKPGDLIWDKKTSGLGVRLGKSDDAKHQFVVQYRIGKGREASKRRIGIGSWTGDKGGLSIDDARERAVQIVADGKRGVDPFAPKQADDGKTFGTCFKEYLDLHKGTWSSGHHSASTSRYNRYLSRLADVPIEEVRRGMVRDAINTCDADVQRNRTATLAISFFRWAANREYVVASPIENLDGVRAKEAKRSRVLIDIEGDAEGNFDDSELRWLLTACNELGTIGDFAKFILYTGARLGEAANMTSDEIDQAKMLWRIPAERNKSRRAYTNVLIDEALDLLPDNDGVVWRGERGGKLLANPDRDIKMIREKVAEVAMREGHSDPIEPFGFHDLRRSLTSWMQREGYGKELRDAVTNHKATEGADAHYSHAKMLQTQRKVLVEWSEFLDGLAPKADDMTNVVKLETT